MEKHGYTQYEISNFQKGNNESRHNLTYWNNESIMDLELGAHSLCKWRNVSKCRPLKQYFNKIDETGFPYLDVHVGDGERKKWKKSCFLRLRKTKGVSKIAFQRNLIWKWIKFSRSSYKTTKKDKDCLKRAMDMFV